MAPGGLALVMRLGGRGTPANSMEAWSSREAVDEGHGRNTYSLHRPSAEDAL